MKRSKARLRVIWNRFSESEHVIEQRLIAYGRAISSLHPLLAEFAWGGNKNGYANMMKQANVWDMTPGDWAKTWAGGIDRNSYYDSFWNRHPSNAEAITQTFRFRKFDDGYPGSIVAGDLPRPLIDETLLMRWLEIMIASFDADGGEIATFEYATDTDGQPALICPLWRAWLKPDVSWDKVIWLEPHIQTAPYATEEPWLGGMLYTWPDYHPERLYETPSELTKLILPAPRSAC